MHLAYISQALYLLRAATLCQSSKRILDKRPPLGPANLPLPAVRPAPRPRVSVFFGLFGFQRGRAHRTTIEPSTRQFGLPA
jgi:hypothetical protein